MNRPIVGLFGVVLALFAVLIGFTSWWTVFHGEELRENPLNRRELLAQERIKRGLITGARGDALARSVSLGDDRYGRRYPPGALFAHAIGYSYTELGRAGLERFRNDELTGERNELVGVLDSLLSEDQVGDDVRTTLDPRAQEAAYEALGDRRGAVVALDVKTGGVLVMASRPSFDPNGLDEGDTFARLNRDTAAPLVNRATQAGYPPGSTFKVVTATAAIDSGAYSPESRVSGRNGKEISGVPLNNFGGQDFGEIDLTTALTNSVNTVWAEVGERVGRRTMREYMERYGFYADPELDYPDEQMTPSGVRKNGRLVPPTSPRVDLGRVAIGQGDLLATPLQMAMVAQTIANGGMRLKPRLTAEVIDPDGRTLDEVEPEEAQRVMSADTARKLTVMMKNVVREGTGTAAALEGVEVAGKTGTAELNIQQRINQPWFIGFAGRVAVAVTVERVVGGQGGTVAAPVAKRVLEALGQ